MPASVVQRTGAAGLKTGMHPAQADKTSFRILTNSVCDIPGFAIKRRGIESLASEKYSELTDWTTSMRPVQAWSFDNSVWVYFESTNPVDAVQSAIAAYEMTEFLVWQEVARNSAADFLVTKLQLDGNKYKMRAKAFDRTLLITTSTGIKRVASLANDSAADAAGNPWQYSKAFRDAGVPPALDPRIPNVVTADNTNPGMHPSAGFEWLPPVSSVSFKICWIYRDENGRLLFGQPSGRTLVRNVSTTDSYAVSMLVPIPHGVDERYVMQEYRTRVITEDGDGVIPDPGDDHYLSNEYRLTAADIAAGFVLLEDLSFDPLLGAALYTNPAQDGPFQQRSQPPMARDIETFGNCAWYVNTNSLEGLTVKILAVDPSGIMTFKGLAVGDVIVAGDLSMEAVAPADEMTQDHYFSADQTVGAGSEVIRAIKTAESFAYKYNILSNKYGGRYSAHCMTTNDDIFGVINLVEKRFRDNSFVSSFPAEHSEVFVGLSRVDAPTQILPSPVFTSTPADTVALKCTVTTSGSSTFVLSDLAVPATLIAGDRIFLAPYFETIAGGGGAFGYPDNVQPYCANTGVLAGEYTVLVATGTTIECTDNGAGTNSVDLADATHGAYIHKTFDSLTGVQTEARSSQNREPSALFYSAPFEPEGVPHFNKLLIGSPDQAVLRVIAITTSMFVFKEDGLWRIQGTDGQWVVNGVDPTCRLIAVESPQTVAGRVFAYTANGIVQVTESGVTKISTDVGGYVDSYFRTLAANVRGARDIVSCAHSEDQAYLIGFPLSAFDANVDLRARAVYRYHIPSKTWSQHAYQSNSRTDSFANNIASLSTFRQTRYDSLSQDRNYIERMIVALSGDVDSIGIERRDATAIDHCDLEVTHGNIITWTPATGTVVFDASLPDAVIAGCVFWARTSYTDRAYRATIASVSTTTLSHDTITFEPVVSQVAYTSWPVLTAGTTTKYILKAIPSLVQYVPQAFMNGFEAGHASEALVEFGSRARFSKASILFGTDKNDTVGTATLDGLAYKEWSDWIVRSETTQTELRTVRAYVPVENARGTQFFVTLSHNRAWEVFDVSGEGLMLADGSHKVRRTL